MNYISEIRAFRQLAKMNSLSASEIALWYALMGINNDFGWQSEFTVPIKVLEFESGLSRSGVYRARNKLKQIGAINWKERSGKFCSVYTINSLVFQYGTQSDTQYDTQHGTQGGTQTEHNAEPLNKQNKNKTKEDTAIPPKGERVNYQAVAELFNETCPSLPKVRDLTDQRKRAIKARIADGNTLEDFHAIFRAVSKSGFLTGKTGGWKCGFDWILKPANWQKIKEGNYNDGFTRNTNPALDYAQRNHAGADLDKLVQY